MDKNIKIFALGGLDEEGKNCLVVEINGDIFVVECGVMTPDKTMPGVDYVIPRFDYLIENKDRIKAYFLLHGHDDEVGALAYVYESCPAPIYASKATLALLNIFTKHVDKDPSMYKVVPVLPTSTFEVAGREINFFHTAHNVADSSGIAISTSYGNIVITGDYVVENTASPTFLHDMNAIAKIAEKPTLALLAESVYSSRPGYTAPLYKLTPHITDAFRNAPGRIFVAMSANSFFNFDEIVRLALSFKRKIVFYDEQSAAVYEAVKNSGTEIPSSCLSSIDFLYRLPEKEALVLIAGFGAKLFHHMALLAEGTGEVKGLKLNVNDTFVVAANPSDKTEIDYTDAVDSLYRVGCKMVIVPKKQFLRMHASEEDLKMMASILKPRFYLPVKGFYKDLLCNAKLATTMGIGLNQHNVFLLSNGSVFSFDGTTPSLQNDAVIHGDLFIDGSGVGDVSNEVIEQREKLENGIFILSFAISKSQRKIVAGPDVQTRGFVFIKDAEPIIKEAMKIGRATIDDFLSANRPYNILEIRQNIGEKVLRAIRRMTGKEPMVLPIIEEVE